MRVRRMCPRFAPVPDDAPAGVGAARNGFAILHWRCGPDGCAHLLIAPAAGPP